MPNPEYARGRAMPESDITDGDREWDKDRNKNEDRAIVETIEAVETTTTALPAVDRARPTRVLQSALRGGRARSRSQDPSGGVAGTRPRSQGPGMRARIGHTRMPTGSLMEVPLPVSTEEEWNELATFRR